MEIPLGVVPSVLSLRLKDLNGHVPKAVSTSPPVVVELESAMVSAPELL